MATRWIAALAAVSLAGAPAAAQASRNAAPVDESETLGGGLGFAWIMAAVMVIGAILIIVDDDDEPVRARLRRGRQLLAGHQEIAVAGDTDDRAVLEAQRSRHRCGKAVAHRA